MWGNLKTIRHTVQSSAYVNHYKFLCSSGHKGGFMTTPYRILGIPPYLAFYRIIDNIVFIYRILHGATNYPTLYQKMESTASLPASSSSFP